MSGLTLKVLVAGAGVGGLALAQALHHAGVEVAVAERDPSPAIRNQGYRIHIDHNGNKALKACLPTKVLAEVRRTSGTNGDLMAALTHRMRPVMEQTFPGLDEDVITNVDRRAFRQALLTGIGDRVQFGRTVGSYRTATNGRVDVYFADGSTDEVDVLVGADGIGSAVRSHLVPNAAVRDLGLRCIYGQMPITAATEPLIPPMLHRGFVWAADDAGYGVGFAPMRFRSRPNLGADAAVDYLMVTMLTTSKRLAPDEKLYALPAADLWALVSDATQGWHPSLRDLIAHANPTRAFPITVRAAERFEPWTAGPVTLLGDAVHAMPPTGGVGANTALQDAATLAGELIAAARGEKDVVEALAEYQRVMLPHGFDVVDGALRMAAQMFGTADVAQRNHTRGLPGRFSASV